MCIRDRVDMVRWSQDGVEHPRGPADEEIERIREDQKQAIVETLPDVMQSLEEENRFDSELFRRLSTRVLREDAGEL